VARYHGSLMKISKHGKVGGREFWVPCSYRCLARFMIYWHLCKINQNKSIQSHKSYGDGSFLPDWSSFGVCSWKPTTHPQRRWGARLYTLEGVQLKTP
jgi:hypothetical protein